MRQIGTQSSRCFRKIVTFVLAFAMIVTSLAVSSTDSQAAKKVKKVSIGVKVGSSGILVLKKGQKKKLKVSVTPKKASKKVTYKSSKSSVVSVSSKGVVKALKSKGSAKITVTSQQNKKKKASIKVKIGTPIKKVSINKKAVCTWTSANWELKMVKGQQQKVYPSYKKTLTASKNTFEVMAGRVITLKTSVSPKKAASKKLRWTSSKNSVATIP
ncbi:MAG: Ig-like domain-containing protein, partial [Roseburia sp.]|nr:Ig-like domain-containing protein [Roseburia sp.]